MDLRACIGQILGAEPPKPAGDELDFWRRWLAGRNLGLVPIDRPAAFAWPGHWIAAVRDSAGAERAVVMFGSPSGPVFGADGLAPGWTIERGWLVARLDLDRDGYGGDSGAGAVEALVVAPDAEAPAVRGDGALAVAGRGLEGDRYFHGRGTFRPGNALTLVAAEELEALALAPEDARRNVVTRGVRLDALVGRRFLIGTVECEAVRLAEPCAHLERLTRPGVLRALEHRAGIRADVLRGGEVHVGDRVEPL